MGIRLRTPEVGQLMRMLVRAKQPKQLIEVGTNIGYSVIVLGREMRGGMRCIETIELDRDILATAKRFVDEAQLTCEVRFHRGSGAGSAARLWLGRSTSSSSIA